MPRRLLTDAERDARAAQRHNKRIRERAPLWEQAGQFDDLLSKGLARERTAEDVAAANLAYRDKRAQGDARAALNAEHYAAYLLEHAPDAHAVVLAQMERFRLRGVHMEGAFRADMFYQAIARQFGMEQARLLFLDSHPEQRAAWVRLGWVSG